MFCSRLRKFVADALSDIREINSLFLVKLPNRPIRIFALAQFLKCRFDRDSSQFIEVFRKHLEFAVRPKSQPKVKVLRVPESLIITTNIETWDEVEKRYGDHIVSRLIEACGVMFRMDGPDRRLNVREVRSNA